MMEGRTEDRSGVKAQKHRKRTKKLLNEIQKQLEFYFSDVNLRHDRFLRKEIEDNPDSYVKISTMLKFNKLKQLTTDNNMLAKAVENSHNLQLSEDRQQLRRKLKLPDIINTDAQTVYVEQLPAYVDHEWLKQVFSTCGTVDYISLPRFTHNKQIKGFAFIEFSNPKGSEKACQMLNTAAPYKSKSKKRHSADVKAADRATEDTFMKRKSYRQRSTSFSGSDSDNKRSISENTKRRRSVSESSEESPIKTKRKRQDSSSDGKIDDTTAKTKRRSAYCKNDNTQNESKEEVSSNSRKRKTEDMLHQENEQTSDTRPENTHDIEIKEGRSKKRKKNMANDVSKHDEHECSVTKISQDNSEEEKDKHSPIQKKNRKHKKKKDEEVKEISVPPLYVISKYEWLALKKQYKNLQRKEVHELKKTKRILKSEKVRRAELKQRIEETLPAKNLPNNSSETITKLHKLEPENSIKENDNYAASMQQKTELVHSDKKPVKSLEINMGTVLSMVTRSEKLTKKEIKRILSEVADVAYVDYLDGSKEGHVRFPTATMVEKVVSVDAAVSSCWTFTLNKLSDEEEKSYLKKVEEDRRKKYEQNDKKKKRKKERGIDKIFKDTEKISSRVHFDG